MIILIKTLNHRCKALSFNNSQINFLLRLELFKLNKIYSYNKQTKAKILLKLTA